MCNRQMRSLDKIKLGIGLVGEVVVIGAFWSFIVLMVMILLGVENEVTYKFVFFILAIPISIAWLIFRVRGFKVGKYYLNQL